ncbi:hypothetical protein CLOP_g15731 [Closterium sp. NIES-67]|nr:hypothetical protein CLOP_g15731 [Closterium sp. NIES-67]
MPRISKHTHRLWNLDCVAAYEEGSKDNVTVKVFKDWSPLLDGTSVIMALSGKQTLEQFRDQHCGCCYSQLFWCSPCGKELYGETSQHIPPSAQ